MKKLYRRSISGLMALLICFTTILGGCITAFAASSSGEVAKSYSIGFPRSGDANLDYSGTWGHDELHYMNGWTSGEATWMTTLHTIGSFDGPACYCIEPGVPRLLEKTYTRYGEDYWKNYPSDYNSTIDADTIKTLLGRIMQYGYQGDLSLDWRSQNESDADKMAHMMATQVLVWETVVGERDANFNHVDPGSADAVKSVYRTAHPLYSRFSAYYYQADVVHGGRLPVHVHFVMDEFANVALPDEFDKLLATMRSREISVSIIIQNLAQLKALFEKQWESLVGNCDEFLYMGGNEQSTHEYVSKLLGKETIDTNTYGQSKGRSGSYSTNWQLTGRELLMPDEVRMLDNQYALLFIRGERPVRDLKYDILKHPNIKLTTDGGAEPYRHGEDVHSIVSIRFDKELLKQAAEKDGQDAPKHRFILLTEEELEQKFIELEEQENAEQQKGK